ncbi:hypothetical protein GOP47_0031019, partial [Adiantum capillus-veneris]
MLQRHNQVRAASIRDDASYLLGSQDSESANGRRMMDRLMEALMAASEPEVHNAGKQPSQCRHRLQGSQRTTMQPGSTRM